VTISELMASDELLCIKEIYLENPSEETRDYVYNRAVEAHNSLKNGTDAAEVMRKYSSYNEAEMSPEHGYYTTEYEMPEYIWKAAESLDDGEISEIIESVYGYHIVIRCEKDTAYMAKCYEAALYSCEKLGWARITCHKDGKIRTREDIFEEIYNKVKEL
jgi:parvulin-like peptidyl-prolyl isomerase